MLDKFPEAFRRFEEVVDVRRIRTWHQLELAFGSWAGRNWGGTSKQVEALRIEARKRGISAPEEPYIKARTWRHETVTVRGNLQHRYRDLKTGRFIKKPF